MFSCHSFCFGARIDGSHFQLWAIIYPIDMIKSRMQTDGLTPATLKYKSTLDCVRTVWRTEGSGAFIRGIVPTLIRYVFESISSRQKLTAHRSPFANGATFVGFEMAMRVLDKI